MALMVGSLYDALKSAGVEDDKARKAAEEVAGFDSQIGRIDNKVTALDGRVNLLQWMIGTNLAMTVAILWRVFS